MAGATIQSPDTRPNLSMGLRGLLDLIDNAKSYDEIQKLPKPWHEKKETSLDEMYAWYIAQPKNGTANGETTTEAMPSAQRKVAMEERGTSQKGLISKRLKIPAIKIWQTIRGVFKCKR